MKKRLKSVLLTFNNGERGMVFPIVLIVLLLAGLMIPPLMSLISTSLVAGETYEANSQELYAADAGVMDASWFLQVNEWPELGLFNPDEVKTTFGDEGTIPYHHELTGKINGLTVSYDIELISPIDSPCEFKITSTATGSDGSTTTIETQVQYLPPIEPIMVAAGATSGDLTLNGTIDAGVENKVGVYAKEWVNLIGGAHVNGDAYYTEGGGVSETDPGNMVSGAKIETPELVLCDSNFPDMPTNIIDKDVSIFNNRELGDVYINGNLNVSGSADLILTGTVWVKGTITIGGDAYVAGKDGELFYLISESASNVAISGIGSGGGQPYQIQAITIALNGGIKLAGTAGINGSAIGTWADISGNSDIANPLLFKRANLYRPVIVNYWKII